MKCENCGSDLKCNYSSNDGRFYPASHSGLDCLRSLKNRVAALEAEKKEMVAALKQAGQVIEILLGKTLVMR